MQEEQTIDVRLANRLYSWASISWLIVWALCLGVAQSPQVDSATSLVLVIGATLSAIIAIGSSIWTGYSRVMKHYAPKDPAELLYTSGFAVNLGIALFMVTFVSDFFIDQESPMSALLSALFMGVGVGGAMYLITRRAKKP